MTDIVVVFHSGYGHTQRVAQAVADGAQARLLQVDADGNLPSEGWALLASADAIIMGSPTYMGGVSWQFKKFADASSKVWYVQGWRNKLFAGFTNSAGMNGDKDATLTYLWHLASQHGGLWVPIGMKPSNDKAARRDSINYVGGYNGLLTTSPTDASPAEMSKGDLETAIAFGEHVAEVARSRGRSPA